MNLYALSVPVYKKNLSNMLSMLDKLAAWMEEKKISDETVLGARLAIDMFPFVRQIQIISDNARFGAAALSGTEPVRMPDEEKTLDELRTRLQKTLEVLDGYQEAAFEGASERKVELAYFPGKYILGEDYLREYALPNFFFHFVTAYNILRHHGLNLGKGDYFGGLNMKDL